MSRLRLIALLLALLTLAVYLPVMHNSFLNFDDDDYVTNNPVVQDGLTWAGVKWAFTTWHAGNWHPITWLSHELDCELFGLNAGAQHCVNAMFHTANAVLLLLLLFRLTGAFGPSAFVAALFALHPLHVESVAWISERKDVLSTLFEVLALLAYTQYAQSTTTVQSQCVGAEKVVPASGVSFVSSHTSRYFWLSVIYFALGLMAKPMLVTLPFVMLLLDYWPLNRIPQSSIPNHQLPAFWRLVFEKWPFYLLSAASCIVTFLAQRNGGLVITLQQLPLDTRLGNALLSYVTYLWKAVWPAKLAIVYPLKNQLPWSQATAATILLAVITWLVWRARQRWPYLLVGWLWFWGTLVPVIGLVQTGGQAMADRYTYVPLVGIFIAVAFGIKDLIARFQIGIVLPTLLAGLVLGSCLVLTRRQVSYWHDSVSLFRHAVDVTKDNDMAHYCLGLALEEQHKWDKALIEYRKAERLAPERYETHRNFADILAQTGKPDEALAEYREAVRLNPQSASLHDNLGVTLANLSHYDEALDQYLKAIQLNPDDSRSYYLMGRTLLLQGNEAQAVGRFREAMRHNPNDLPTLIFLASVLASSENPHIRNGTEAIALAEKANILTDSREPLVLDTLAMACAEAGRFNDAQQFEQRAIQLALAASLKETNVMNQRLELYQSGHPYHQTFSSLPSPKLLKD
jgi:tetratricopeptide (TPR) repeat protein